MTLHTRMPVERLGLDDEALYVRMQTCAAMVIAESTEAWKRPVRHNRRIERAALYSTVKLDAECQRVLERRPELLRPSLSTPLVHYELEAAIRIVPSVLPFDPDEAARLRDSEQPRDGGFWAEDFHPETGRPGITTLHPDLLDRWHSWLWIDGDPGTRGQQPNPEALVLAEGCARLAQSVGAVLLAHEQQADAQPE